MNAKENNWSIRLIQLASVLIALTLTGCNGKPALVSAHGKPVSHWLDELKLPDPEARKKAVTVLGHVGKADPAAIPALIGAAKDPDATVRDEAVLALLNIGPDAKEAIAALTEAQSDTDPTVRLHANKAIERIRGTK